MEGIISCLAIAAVAAAVTQWVNDTFELGGYMSDDQLAG